MSGTSEPAWVLDNRPGGLVTVVTRTKEREGTIQIHEDHAQTSGGQLTLTDEQLQAVAELSIRLTRYLQP
ncbi:hypothetical protein ACWF9G_15410 [Nocardia sp. NPDC055029]